MERSAASPEKLGLFTSVIVRLDQKKVYLLNHPQETFTEIDLPVDFANLLPEGQREAMKPMMDMMAMTAKVTPTDETRTINGWETRKWDVELSNKMGMQISTDAWVTQDIDTDLDTFKTLTRQIAALQPGGDDWIDELLKLDGVPVLQETTMNMMGSTVASREQLVSVKKQAAPAGTFEVPAGYEAQEFNPMASMAGQ